MIVTFFFCCKLFVAYQATCIIVVTTFCFLVYIISVTSSLRWYISKCEIDKLSYIKIHMNVSYVMTNIFTYMNFYTVNMNYLWNDIYTYYVEWYIPTMLSSSKQTVSGHSFVCSSTCTYQYTNYCNSNQKFYSQYPKWQISAYWDIGSNIIYVMMKHINQFILWSLKSTMKYNDMYNNFYTYEIFQWQMT